jgi:hypothetical protein
MRKCKKGKDLVRTGGYFFKRAREARNPANNLLRRFRQANWTCPEKLERFPWMKGELD